MGKKSGFKPSITPKGIAKVLVRLSYCNPFTKTKSSDTSRALYRSNGLIYKDDKMDGDENLKVLREARLETMRNYTPWKGKNDETLTKLLKGMDADRRGILNGDEYTDDQGDVREHYEGVWYVKATSDRKPKLKNRRGDELDEEEAEDLIRSGYWAVMYLHFYCVSNKDKGGNGVFATLDALQFFKKDEAFSAAGIDDEDIDDLGDGDDEEEDDMEDKPKGKSDSSKSKKPADDDDEEI